MTVPGVLRVGRVRRPAFRREHGEVFVLCAICGLALALRFVELDDVAANPFYDAAVRSMGESWRNFFLGAFEPGGRLAIDKPAVALWFQVASVHLLGFGPLALKLPEALAGTLAVPLLYDTVRRLFGRGAGLIAAAALAVLPVSVLTARSDTVDSVMMALLVLAAWLTVRAVQQDRFLLLIGAAVALGIAFNVKLAEALVAVPALAAFYSVGSSVPARRRALHLLGAGGALALVALSWVAIASLVARAGHPFPIGSSDGTEWDVVFGFNGQSRLATPPGLHGIVTPGPARLLAAEGHRYGPLIGSELGPAIMIGLVALLAKRRAATRLARAGMVGVGLWLLVGLLLFSDLGRLQTRYLEAFTPAVAAALGAGLASLAWRGGPAWRQAGATALVLGAAVAYEAYVAGRHHAALAVAVLAAALAVAARTCVAARIGPKSWLGAAAWSAAALAGLACLAVPAAVSVQLVRDTATDAGTVAVLPPAAATRLNAYLGAHRQGARYEVAADKPTVLATAIIAEPRPILPLTSWEGRPLVGLAELKATVAAGQVRFVLIDSSSCRSAGQGGLAACLPTVRWARRHGIDVTAAVGLPSAYRLLRMSRR